MFARGAIGFSTHRNGRLSRAIRWFTGQPWSHTFVVTDIIGNRKDNKHRVYILDANAGGRVSHNIITNYGNADTEFEIWMPKDQNPEDVSWSVSFTEICFRDKSYSLWSLFTSALKLFTKKRLKLPVVNPERGTNCVQVTSLYLEQLFDDFKHRQRLGQFISPGDLHEWVKSSGQFELIHQKKFDAPLGP